MLIWTFNVIVLAMAMISPVLLVWLWMERHGRERDQRLHADMQHRWVDRYRSLTDIVLTMVEVNEKSAGQIKRTYQLMQRLQNDNNEIAEFLRKVMKR